MPGLTVLHTNDLHARFDQMARLGALIQAERAAARAANQPLLLLDAGDSSSAEVWESAVTLGRANLLLLEAIGYDAAAVGNSDSQWGSGPLDKLIAAVHFPLLAANLRLADGERLAGLTGYALFRFDDLNVAVIGLTTAEETHADFRLRDPAETLSELLPQVRAEGAQCVIVLSHLGLDADRQLAAAVPGLDVIVGGHTHSTLPQPERVAGCAIVQTGEFGAALGRVDLTWNLAGGAPSLTGRLIACDPHSPPDPTASGMLELIRFEAAVIRKNPVK